MILIMPVRAKSIYKYNSRVILNIYIRYIYIYTYKKIKIYMYMYIHTHTHAYEVIDF